MLSFACSDSTGPEVPKIGAVSITVNPAMLVIGDSVQLAAVVLDEGGVAMSGQSVTWSSSNPAVASVRSSGIVSAHAGGATFVRVTSGEQADSVEIRVRPGTCAIASVTGTIDLGHTRNGSHTASDCLYEGEAADGWRFTLTSPAIVDINLTSVTGLAELILTDSDMNVMAYSAENGSSAQIGGPLVPGSYVIWTRASPGATLGTYALSAQFLQTPVCSVAAGSIALGQTVSSRIEESDCVFRPDFYADSWQLSVAAQTTLQIDLMSAEFDPILLLTNDVGQWLAIDDDGGGYPNSRLVLTLPAGEYKLVASTYSPLTTGQYQLAVHSASASARRVNGMQMFSRSGVLPEAGGPEAGGSSSGVWPIAGKQGSR
jgi:hypothetical protein